MTRFEMKKISDERPDMMEDAMKHEDQDGQRENRGESKNKKSARRVEKRSFPVPLAVGSAVPQQSRVIRDQ